MVLLAFAHFLSYIYICLGYYIATGTEHPQAFCLNRRKKLTGNIGKSVRYVYYNILLKT